MKRLIMTQPIVLLLGALAFTGPLQAQNADLGRIEFPTSGSPEAQEHFLKGVLLLHSFEYDDAKEEFQKAQTLDPGFAMAYWGEAMTYNHPIWVQVDREAARATLSRFAPTPEARLAKAPTEREKAYLRASEILYGDGDKLSRDLAYAEAMRQLAEQYPDDLEAASFYALALLGTCQGERDFRTYMKAAAVVEEVFSKNPLHPGATHYLIHSYDEPVHGPLGLRAARVYAKIAPAAAHAQHMPSHIFLALGMWDETVASNETSWAVADARVKRKGLSLDDRNFHALYWLEYGYLQQGRYRDARRLLSIMEEDTKKSGSRRTREHLARMRAAYIIEARQWDGDAARIGFDTADLGLEGAVSNLFATGVSAIITGNRAAAERALSEMKTRRETLVKSSTTSEDSTHHSHETLSPALKTAEIVETELQALIHLAAGKSGEAVNLMKEATAAEDSLSFEFGPPIPVKPSHELFGEILLQLNQPAEARKQFELALDRAPKRVLSLLGLARAAAKSGDQATAQQTYDDLRRIWRKADAGLKELEEVSRAMAEANQR
jgi:tetratricopeptide (TPR) repeat protein